MFLESRNLCKDAYFSKISTFIFLNWEEGDFFSMSEKKRSNFSGHLGFILASAGSAVGLGNIWRFPYLAAKDGGGIFILVYLILAVTFGFTLLTTEIAIGRKTKQSPLTAYKKINSKFAIIGVLACSVPTIILPYYCTIGGWVLKYLSLYITGNGNLAVADGFFGSYITSFEQPIIWMIIFFILTAGAIIVGVEKGIEKVSKILMPILVVLIIGISCFSLFITHTDENGITRTGLQGLKVYLIPNFNSLISENGFDISRFLSIVMDALGQLFFSISVAMGIMVAYGSYAKKEVDLGKSINHIELFDTAIALLAGLMIIPAVFAFSGEQGMSAGPGLIFVNLPKVFSSMGSIGTVIATIFFLIVSVAAVTSSMSVMEAVVSSAMDKFKITRIKASIFVSIYALIFGVIVCLGYNKFYFELKLPNGSVAQILDLMDYISNSVLMPIVAFLSCILIGWVAKPKYIIEEVTIGGVKFQREKLYVIMIKFVAPILLLCLLINSAI